MTDVAVKAFVVSGATGRIGKPAVRMLLDAGHAVRGIVNSLESAHWLQDAGADAFLVDLTASVPAEPFRGADGALLIVPVGEDMQNVGKALVDASVSAGVPRIVRISIDSAMKENETMLGSAHGAVDDHLAASGTSYMSVGPSGFMQNFLGMAAMVHQGALVAPTGDGKVPFIDSRDIAAVAVAGLTDRADFQGHVDVSGPEPLSFSQIAALLSERLGKAVHHISPAAKDAREGLRSMGFDGWLLDAMMEDTASVAAGLGAAVRRGVQNFTGREPRTMESFLDENIEAFRE